MLVPRLSHAGQLTRPILSIALGVSGLVGVSSSGTMDHVVWVRLETGTQTLPLGEETSSKLWSALMTGAAAVE